MKHTSKCFLWALAWSCTIAPLAAQQTYTLDECIENALHDNLSDRSKPFWMGFATVSIPLSGWWEGSHDMKRARLAVRNNENSLRDGSELLIINMQNTWNAMTDAYKQVQIAIESIGQAAENLRLQTDYYQAGTCTMSDLLEAQSLYQQSRDRYVESYAQYEVKKREYLQATGR